MSALPWGISHCKNGQRSSCKWREGWMVSALPWGISRCMNGQRSGKPRHWVSVSRPSGSSEKNIHKSINLRAVLRIQIRILRILLFLVLPDPDPLVRGTAAAPDGPFYHQAKIVRKTLIPSVLWHLYDFLSLKNDVNVASKQYHVKPMHGVLGLNRKKTKWWTSFCGEDIHFHRS